MHDFDGLLAIMGRELMLQRLHLLFNATCSSALPDTTGLIGCYAQGNEPSHHVIFWYYLLGEHATARKYLDQVIRMYTDASDGLPGNDDAGQMSAWLVVTMLGWYPVDPTSSSVLSFRPRVKLKGKTKRLACLMGCHDALHHE